MDSLKAYWSLTIEYSAQKAGRKHWPTDKTGPFSILSCGVFKTRDEACVWASRELGPGPWMAVKRCMITSDCVGCIADGSFGHKHVRAKLADLCEAISRKDLATLLRGEMSDDAGEESEALDALNDECADDVHFNIVDGDLVLVSSANDCPECGEADGHSRTCPASL